MRAPRFWGSREYVLGRMLSPAGALYGAASGLRQSLGTGATVEAPVICVGNLVAGGAGKTPVAISIASILSDLGRTPHLLSRGYGGRLAGPVRVDPDTHTAADVGDEPLLLAAAAPTWVSRDRPAGARAALVAGADAIVMDDGYQNPGLVKDFSLVVVDAAYGFGNRRVMPAGPLRESLARGLKRADAVVVLGEGEVEGLDDQTVLRARITPDPDAAEALAGKKVLAFAGIGRPEKFFDTLRAIGADVVIERIFPDHFTYSASVIDGLAEEAGRHGLVPVTTTKDAMRLPTRNDRRIASLPVSAIWEDEAALRALLAKALG